MNRGVMRTVVRSVSAISTLTQCVCLSRQVCEEVLQTPTWKYAAKTSYWGHAGKRKANLVKAVRACIQNRDINALHWLHVQRGQKGIPVNMGHGRLAIELDLVQFLDFLSGTTVVFRVPSDVVFSDLFCYAVNCGSWNCALWITTNAWPLSFTSAQRKNMCDDMVRRGAPLALWTSVYAPEIRHKALEACARYGCVELAKWVTQRDSSINASVIRVRKNRTLALAVERRNFSFADWLVDTFLLTRNDFSCAGDYILKKILVSANRPALEWSCRRFNLTRQYMLERTSCMLASVLLAKDVNFLKYFLRKFEYRRRDVNAYTRAAMKTICQYGSKRALQFMFRNGYISIRDVLYRNGYYERLANGERRGDIVGWLRATRTEYAKQ